MCYQCEFMTSIPKHLKIKGAIVKYHVNSVQTKIRLVCLPFSNVKFEIVFLIRYDVRRRFNIEIDISQATDIKQLFGVK